MRWTPEVPEDGYEAFAVPGSPAQRAVLSSFGGRLALMLSANVLLVIALTTGPASSRQLGAAVGVAGAISGWSMIRFRHVIPIGLLDALVPVSVAVFGWMGAVGGALEPIVPFVFTVYGAQIYAMRSVPVAVLHTALLGAGYAAILEWGPDTGPVVTHWLVVMAAIVSSAFFTQWLMRKVQTLAMRERAARSEAEAASEALAEVGEAKGQFLARVSHELRTPLNAVVGFSELLQAEVPGPLSDQQRDYVGDIVSSSRHLHSLVDDVLDLASVQSGSPSLELTPVSVADVMAEAVTMVRAQATDKRITIALEIAPDVGESDGDRRKIRQVALNLLSNAVKFTGRGGRIDVSVKGSANHVVVTVADTGIGIPARDHERIFEAYDRGGEPGEGTGLGLAVARRLVELHGGHMWVDSSPGEGSTFSFRLPRRVVVPTLAHDGRTVAPADPTHSDVVMAFAEPGSDANRSMLAQIGAGFALLATALGVVVALVTPGEGVARVGVGMVAVCGIVAAMWFRRRSHRPSVGFLDVIAAAGIAVISAAVVWAGQFADLVPLGYLWVVLVAAALHTRVRTVSRVLGVGVAYAMALWFSPGSHLDPGRWVSVMTMLVANVMVVDWTVGRIREVAAAERAARQEAELVRAELASSSRHQSEFLASMSHELRTPLNAVIGFSDVLNSGLAGPLTDQQADYLREVLIAGRHLLDLINDLLDLAKLDADRLVLDVVEVPVGGLITGATAVVEPTARRKGVEIVEQVPAGIGSVTGDPDRLEQALCNLLVNAVECTPPRGRITVSAQRDGDVARVSVADTGTGIDTDQMNDIFAPFHRGSEDEPGPTQPGPGLGLALVKGLVELHGGTVSVDSIRGHGAVFTVALPGGDGDHATASAPASEVSRG